MFIIGRMTKLSGPMSVSLAMNAESGEWREMPDIKGPYDITWYAYAKIPDEWFSC